MLPQHVQTACNTQDHHSSSRLLCSASSLTDHLEAWSPQAVADTSSLLPLFVNVGVGARERKFFVVLSLHPLISAVVASDSVEAAWLSSMISKERGWKISERTEQRWKQWECSRPLQAWLRCVRYVLIPSVYELVCGRSEFCRVGATAVRGDAVMHCSQLMAQLCCMSLAASDLEPPAVHCIQKLPTKISERKVQVALPKGSPSRRSNRCVYSDIHQSAIRSRQRRSGDFAAADWCLVGCYAHLTTSYWPFHHAGTPAKLSTTMSSKRWQCMSKCH